MPETVEYLKEKGFILLRSFEETTIQMMRNSVAAAQDISKIEDVYDVLVDARKLHTMPGVLPLFEFVPELPIKLRFAVVVTRTTPEVTRFMESAAQNRSRRFRVFDDYAAAVEWLRSGGC
jgi:hypothetical protein